jgi:hypothetical protein
MLIMSMAGSDRRGTSGGSEMKRALIALLIIAPLYGGDGEGKKGFHSSGVSFYAGPLWSRYMQLPNVALVPESRGVPAGNLGAVLGGSWQFRFGKHLVLDGGFQASERGTIIKWYNGEELAARSVYSFVMSSALAEVRIRPLHGSSPYALAGYDISYVSRHEATYYIYPYGMDWAFLKQETAKIDMGVFAGGGLEIDLKKWMPFVEVRYNWGLLDVSRGNGALGSYPVIKTRALMVLAGVRFKWRNAGLDKSPRGTD